MSTARAYCVVDGCLSGKRNKDLNFFKLPMDEERRNEWLKIIGRPDLMNRPDLKPQSYVVCSMHFDDDMIIMKPQLKPEAKPTKHLPELAEKSHEAATYAATADACSQTERSTILKSKMKAKSLKTDTATSPTDNIRSKSLNIDTAASPTDNIRIVKVESKKTAAAVLAESIRKRKRMAREEEERKRKAAEEGGFVVEIYGRGAIRKLPTSM